MEISDMEKTEFLKTIRDSCDECYVSNVGHWINAPKSLTERLGHLIRGSNPVDVEKRDKVRRYIQDLIDSDKLYGRTKQMLRVCNGCDYSEPQVGDLCNDLYRDELAKEPDERDREIGICKSIAGLGKALNEK